MLLQTIKKAVKTSLFGCPIFDRYEAMWIAKPGAKVTENIDDPRTQQALQELIAKGFAVLPGNVPEAACDALLADFNAYCGQHPERAYFADEYGLHDRLANLHLVSAATRVLAPNSPVRKIIRTAFAERDALAGSLFFEKGSTQSIHRDTPAFFTVPLNHFFGVWHALADIHSDAGALTYYVGGHNALQDRQFVSTGYENLDWYFAAVRNDCRKRG